MDPLFPDIDFDPSWYWPNSKFGLDPHELFTTLHDRFNTKKFPLQNPFAFHRDVYECAEYAETRDEFYSKLEERKAQRIKEMTEAWDEIGTWLVSFPHNMFCQLCYDEETMEVKLKPDSLNDDIVDRGAALSLFTRTMAFDSMVMFFDGFARDERKRQEDMEREIQRRRMEYFKSRREAERLAAAPQVLFPCSSHGAASSEPESSRDASTSKSPSPGATIGDKPNPTSSSRRRGPDQPETLAQARTAESSTRKRKIDENANGPERKKQRVRSERAEDEDAESPAGQDEQRAAKASPTSEQAGKRKSVDDFRDDTRKKRRRTIDDPTPDSKQPPEWAAEMYRFAQDRTSSEATRASSLCSTAVPPHYDPDMTDDECDQRGLRRSKSTSPVSTDDNPSFTTAQSSPDEDAGATARSPAPKGYVNAEPLQRIQASPERDGDGLTAKTSTISAGTRKLNRKPRQRVDKRRPRREQRPPTQKKQPRQRKLQEQNASPLAEQILHSNRSSRRGPAQELWFLGGNGVPCAVVSKKRN